MAQITDLYSSPEEPSNYTPHRLFDSEMVYLARRYELNTGCEASIKADSDITGPGTLLSFSIPAALTVGLAIMRAVCLQLSEWSPEVVQPAALSTQGPLPETLKRKIWRRSRMLIGMCNTLLGSLCDLQAITGSAIIISAFMQGSMMSFYHEEIVMQYWWLIMNSFWCAQHGATDGDDHNLKMLRKVLTLVAVLLGLVFQVRGLIRRARYWDYLDGQRCFLYNNAYGFGDDGLNLRHWLTTVGIVIYLMALSASLFEPGRKWLESTETRIRASTADWLNYVRIEKRTVHDYLRGTTNTNHPASSHPVSWIQILRSSIMTVFSGIVVVSLFCAHQFLAYWSYADGYMPIQILLRTYHVVIQTIILFALKRWNRGIIAGDETSWGFGQCLPIIMLASFLLSLFVMFREKHLNTS